MFLSYRQTRRRRYYTSLLGIGAILCWTSSAIAKEGPSTWTPRTSVEMRYYANVGGEGDGAGIGVSPIQAFLPSPDGSRFLTVSRVGDIQNDANVFELRIYSTSAVLQAVQGGKASPRPLLTVTRRSQVRPAFDEFNSLEWSEDGRYVRFDGAEPGIDEQGNIGIPALFRLNTKTGSIAALARSGEKGQYLVDTNDEYSLYVDFMVPALRADKSIEYPYEAVTLQTFARVAGLVSNTDTDSEITGVTANANRSLGLYLRQLSTGNATFLSRIGGQAEFNLINLVRGKINPQGDTAILAMPYGDEPAHWRQYDKFKQPLSLGNSGMTRPIKVMRFVKVDLHTGKMQTLLDAPTGEMTSIGRAAAYNLNVRPDVLWHRDGTTAVLVNTAVPLAAGGSASKEAYLASYDSGSGRVEKISSLAQEGRDLSAVRWSSDGDHLVTEWKLRNRPGNLSTPTVVAYRFRSGKFMLDANWQEEKVADRGQSWTASIPPEGYTTSDSPDREYRPSLKFANGLTLTLDESVNRPQRLVASYGEYKMQLDEADPVLLNVGIAKSDEFSFRTKSGKTFRAHVTLPDQPGGKFPIVVELDEFHPTMFRPDGVNSFATQSLVARGLAVVTLHREDLNFESTDSIRYRNKGLPDEIERMADVVQSAIEEVSKNPRVDVGNVGIIGFSRTGFFARQLLIRHDKVKFKAAVVMDSYNPNFTSITFNMSKVIADMRSRVISDYYPLKGIFWDNPDFWNKNAVDLAANRATGALLETYHGSSTFDIIQSTAPLLGPFMLTGRPLEFLSFPGGRHPMVTPRHRLAEMTNLVDWMDFWLNGREDADPKKAPMYARWKLMQERWAMQQAWENAGNPPGSIPRNSFQFPKAVDNGQNILRH